MKNLTIEALENLKENSSNKLEITVLETLLEKGDESEIVSYIKDLVQHGCISGMEGSLIYYNDTVKFYQEYKEEIKRMLKELMDDCGFKSPVELFGDKWDNEDYFAEEDTNQNLLAWFGFEETVRNIGRNFEDLEDYV